MQVRLDHVGQRLKASVKQEAEDDPTDGLGWAMDGAAAEEVDEEGDEYDQEVEEEIDAEAVEQEQEDHNSWTQNDWEHVKRHGANALNDAVADVDKWDSMKQRWGQPAGQPTTGWKIKAPWASKPAKAKQQEARIRKTDKWGGQCWSDGWYRDKTGKWWPQLSNNFGGLSFVC